MNKLFQRPAAIALAILDLRADLRERLALPRHFTRRETPCTASIRDEPDVRQ
jgi:hypothetical protein